VIGLYYYGDVTMKQIGAEIGVNESRVSQLHARAIQRLRRLLGPDLAPEELGTVLNPLDGVAEMKMAKANLGQANNDREVGTATKKRSVLMSYVDTRTQQAVGPGTGAGPRQPSTVRVAR